MDIKKPWALIAAGNKPILDLNLSILSKNKKRTAHSGGSWVFLCYHFEQLAKKGVPERFLIQNKKFWVAGYYMPTYYPQLLFAAGAGAIVAAALKYKTA